MTREEAIAFFKDMNECTYGNLEAVEMGIKALEYDDTKYHEEHGEVIIDKAVWEDAKRALEQEPCEDAISRKVLISHIENQSREWGEDYDVQQILGDIEDMPSVKPQPKTGHWIEHPEIKTITPEIMFYECSECGDKQCFCKSDIHKKHFCNYCGARMVEPTCDTCEYNTAAFNPCNACKDKSEYKPQEGE